MYCFVYGKVHIKDPLLLIEKSSLCGGSGFPSKKCVNVTIWMTSNNRWQDKNQCVPVASLNKTNFTLSDSERGNPQGFFYKHHPTDRIAHTTAFVTPVVEHWLEREIAQWVHHEGSIRRPIAPWANALTTELHLAPWYLLNAKDRIFSIFHSSAGYNYIIRSENS